ncbi:MAG: multicopper oxidase domain-containing protein, partial [Propionicimonas sp.]
NGGLALWLLPTPSWVKVTGSLLALCAALAFLPLLIGGLRAAGRAKRDRHTADPMPTVAQPAGVLSAGQLIAGLTAVATVVVIGVGVDPAAAGVGATPSAGASAVVATGKVVRVEVRAVGMRYVPAQVHLSRGDRLVVDLVNADTTTHDLVIGQARTGRIAPGASAELDAGVIGESTTGFCSVVGHRQMGMVFEVIVDGAAAQAAPADQQPADPGGHAGHQSDGEAPPLAGVVDPVLPALTDARVHRLTLTVGEVGLEVAPGVWQRRWTFNGTAPGPTLHGRVGDSFEITLVNDGTIGHSIDFHAGSLAPNEPMRTIEPGESLVYRFTATMAGVWMYHCSTMPMSAHIAAGMFGAVVIEPDGLPAVDRSYLLVQSEVYLGTAAADAAGATEVVAAAVADERPDYVTFNGIANGYDQQPLVARTGERVRFWVLDAGPNRPSSFHVVGAQFDTVYAEGRYLLRGGRDGFGTPDGGSQVLGLLPAQGGFAEAVFVEAGRYPVVSHVLVDAER